MGTKTQQNNTRLGESDLSSFDDIQDMQYQRSNEALYLADRQRILSRVVRMFGLGIFLVLGTTGYHLATQGGPKPPAGDKGPVGSKGYIGDKGERGEKGPGGGPHRSAASPSRCLERRDTSRHRPDSLRGSEGTATEGVRADGRAGLD